MRETRLSGSEGGGARTRSPYPYLHPPCLGKLFDKFRLRGEKRWLQSCPQLEPPVAVVLFFRAATEHCEDF
jgi:hypothetical protein